jgi:hypothetical protein
MLDFCHFVVSFWRIIKEFPETIERGKQTTQSWKSGGNVRGCKIQQMAAAVNIFSFSNINK